MTDDEPIAITVTSPDRDGLVGIVRQLLDAHLAACANIIPGVTSVYWWDETIQQEDESLAILHTRRSLLPALEARIAELHPYETPQIVAFSVTTTSPYAQWIMNSTSQAPRG